MVNGEDMSMFGMGGVNFNTNQNFDVDLTGETPIKITTGKKEEKEKKKKKSKSKSFLDKPLVGKKKSRQRTRLGKGFKADVSGGVKGLLRTI